MSPERHIGAPLPHEVSPRSDGGRRMTRMLKRTAHCALTVTFAVTAVPAIAFAQAPTGRYECWFFSSARPGLNFTLLGDGRYTDVNGSAGTVSAAGAVLTFTGAALDGQRGQYKGGNPPTVAILGPRGDEVSSCQLKR